MVAIVSGIIVALLASADDGEPVLAVDSPPVVAPTPAPAQAEEPPPPLEPPVTVPIEGTDAPPTGAIPLPPVEPAVPLEPEEPLPSAEDLFPPEEGVPSPGVIDPFPVESPDGGAPLEDPPGPPQLDPSDFEPVAPAPTSPAPPSELETWPSGTDGFTVILASIPESRGRAEADARAARARAAGLDEVGVLLSSSFDSLRTGYWVTFTGVHSTLNAARAELAPARAAGFPTAYTRRVAS